VIAGRDSGTASDVHSWGATVAFAATGRPPFGTGAFETIFYRIVHGQPDLDTLPAPLVPMVTRALARDQAIRPSAAELALWAASLDPALLVPAPPGAAEGLRGPGAPLGMVARTVTDHPALPVDVGELLPPAAYAGARNPVAGTAGRKAESVRPVSAWSPLVLASVAVLVAVSLIAPIVGTAISLGVLVALRAAGITGRQLARRRADGSGRPAGSVVAVALYPLALLRAAVVLFALLPVALLGAAIAAAVTIVAVPAHPLPQALALAAGTLVAVAGCGPGSSSSRTALARFFTAAGGGATSRVAVVYFGVLAVTAWAVVTAWQLPAAYWPVANPHVELLHLPTVHGLLTDIRQSLLALAHRYGL
jgi:hypothetical protein